MVGHDQAPGVTLTVACLAALVWANVAGESYQHVWSSAVSALGVTLSWRDWVNEGVMLGFFGLIGLEIRREVIVGELRRWRRAATPVIAALGGMVVPGLLYAVTLVGRPGGHGWGIPVATDVAFSLSALAIFGGKGSGRSRVFLMTLAVADDVFSVVLLVVGYSGRVQVGWLLLGVGCLASMGLVAWARRSSVLPTSMLAGWIQVVLGLVAWFGLLHAGVEAAVAGVAIGALAPRRVGASQNADHDVAHHAGADHPRADHSSIGAGTRVWELRLTPVVNLIVLPLFALANSGVRLAGAGLGRSAELRLFVVILLARVVAKPVGIYGTTFAIGVLARRRGAADASAPENGLERIGRPKLAGLAATSSIGFTVPLLIVPAALPAGAEQGAAIVALLAGSVAGAGVSALLLVPQRRRAEGDTRLGAGGTLDR